MTGCAGWPDVVVPTDLAPAFDEPLVAVVVALPPPQPPTTSAATMALASVSVLPLQ